MYISELNIHGFKSFARREKLKFGDGVTAIVGPNGCGKTNIVDAIRWVLGEQKYSLLRSSRMEDIIFNGSESRRPLNVCDVSLTVQNDKGELPIDYTDVEISRRVFRNGESEYMVNRTPCRLKDIQSLFMDTGMGANAYSVIELSMIEDILSENTDDRRRMFEEAAGINRYKSQRKEALRKFEASRGDLNRVNDIIAEVESKVHALKLQLKRYDRHALLMNRLKQREVELANTRVSHLLADLRPLNDRITALKLQRTRRVDEEKGREMELEELQKAYDDQQDELNALQSSLNDLLSGRQEVSNRILVLNEQVKSSERTVERLEVEREESSKKIDTYKFQIQELNVDLESLEPRIEQKSTIYADKRVAFERINSFYAETEKKLERLNSRSMEHLQKINSTRSLLERTQDTLDEKMSQLSDMERRATDLESNQADLETKQKRLEKERTRVQQMVSMGRKRLKKTDDGINDLRSEKHNLSLEFHRVANQVEFMESQLQFYKEIIENKEGYPSGVRHVLAQLKNYPDVIGTVGDVIKVEEKYRRAIEAGLGSLSQSLICKTRKSALQMLDQLRHEKVGKVSLIPLDSPVPKRGKNPLLPETDGIVGMASDLVKCRKELEPLVKFLLNDLVIVKDVDVAESLWNSKGFSGSVADLTGCYYDQSGVIMSIDGEGEMSILGREEKITALDKEIDCLVKRANETQGKSEKVDSALEEKERRQQSIAAEIANHLDKLAQIEKQITRTEFSISQNIEFIQNITHQIVAVRKEILNLERSLDRLEPPLKELQDQQHIYLGKIEETKKALKEIKMERDRENNIIQDFRFELISLENERDNLHYKVQAMEGNIGELQERRVDLSSEIERVNAERQQMAQEIGDAEKRLQKLTAKIRKKLSIRELKEQAVSETYRRIGELQKQIRTEQREREQLSEALKRCELKAADLERRIELQRSRIKEKYGLEIPSMMKANMSEDELVLQIDRLERSIERIGPVNMAVKEEHEEERKRLEFLCQQREDLIESEKSLLETMRRIDFAARTQFMETFAKIRVNFQKTFKLFFEGGEADLRLRGDDDPLEADVAIFAQPPGKRTRNLRMLSAGEKALTAIALLFAIYQEKPSPFCILDEVDAPLDDNNIGKFTRVLKKFSHETQFIVVTHNKLTMDAAQYLYGVTMEQSGISKIVSVKLD